MKTYKWILLIISIILFFEISWRLEQYYNHNRWKNKTSSEIQNMITRIKNEKASLEVKNLWNYYLVRGEYDNTYLTLCFMYKRIDLEERYRYQVNRVLSTKKGKEKLEQCPTNPLQLIEDNNTFWDKVEAWFLFQLGEWIYNN